MMDPALRDLMADTITLAPYQANGVDGYGEPIWGAPVAYKARVQIGAVRWFNAEMREITAGGRVIFDLPPGGRMPDIKDKLALPADFGPAAPKILDVVAQRDEIGRHHVTLIVG